MNESEVDVAEICIGCSGDAKNFGHVFANGTHRLGWWCLKCLRAAAAASGE